MKARHIQGEGLANLVGGDAQRLGAGLVDPQKRQRVRQVEPVLARRHKADPRPGLAPDAFVDPVGAGKGLGGKALLVDHPRFLSDPVVVQTDIEAALGHREIGGDECHSVKTAIDDGGDFDRVLHCLEADPKAGKPRQGKAIEAVI